MPKSPLKDAPELDSEVVIEDLGIALERDAGARYEQLEHLALHESVQDWRVYRAAHKSNKVCREILQQIRLEKAYLEPHHLSMLRKIITEYQKGSDYFGTSPGNRLLALQDHLS